MRQFGVALKIIVQGQVQGVGFRPRLKRLADSLDLAGWVRNQGDQVQLQVPAEHPALTAFLDGLRQLTPELSLSRHTLDKPLPQPFTILPSLSVPADGLLQLPADRGTCAACRAEYHDPSSRRFHYPLISCHDCGPRLAILQRMPFCREHTSLQPWQPCALCQAEFADAANRRFHSELISCPQCGPQVRLLGESASVADSFACAVACLQRGGVLGVKSQSGFQLLCRASDEQAVARLRDNKRRPFKPLAMLVESAAQARRLAILTTAEIDLLEAPARPIVLVTKRGDSDLPIAANVSAGTPDWGLMLPVSGLHLALVDGVGEPLVCTSANVSGEPLLYDDAEMANRWRELCDLCLSHDLPVMLPQDDSVVMNTSGRTQILRRGRGFSHARLQLPGAGSVLAWGGDLKHAFAFSRADQVILSPFIGDMETIPVRQRQQRVLQHLAQLHDCTPQRSARDLHPGYHTHGMAASHSDVTPLNVQHHVAHVALNDALCPLPERYLALAWDGTGWGEQGDGWGSEAFLVERGSIRRVAMLAPFSLPGGEAAVRQPWRVALALCFHAGMALQDCEEYLLQRRVPQQAIRVVWQMLARGLNAPSCHAMGRLFDAVSCWLTGCDTQHFEGDAPLRLQALAGTCRATDRMFPITNEEVDGMHIGRWQPAWISLLNACQQNTDPAQLAFAFHQGIIQWALALARIFDVTDLSLSGGCFQNRLLQSLLLQQQTNGIRIHWPTTIPINDGGLAVGQLQALARGWTHLI